ncbi:unnamed protein product [Spirodela intermedia]|uniref:Uncharacterized protein n=1 Tax=Spirodela intermedia TaxID=51605 RepID=A0ABN7EDN4_SPIIN|nr:unnamed protein product [Spirodela intermedia]
MQAGGGHSAAVVTALEEVREVWEWNMRTELPRILEAFDSATCAALDTEFPGHNLHNLKLIQLGLSFFSDGGRRRTWQISFRDFDVASASDAPSEASVELLKRSDVDLGRTRREGVHSEVLSDCGDAPVGDVPGALRRGVHGEAPHRAAVTADAPRFVQLVGATLGRVVDVKYLARPSSEETEQEEELLLICPLHPSSTLFLTPAIVFSFEECVQVNRSQDLRFQSKYSRSMLKCSSGDPVLSSVFL